jgi:hypothetical protein
MSWYRVQEIDILRVGQLYLQADINSTYPSAGTVLYTDGVGGTFFSTAGAGGGGGGGGTVTDAILNSTIQGLGLLSYVSSTQLQSTVQGLGNFYTSTAASGITGSQLVSTVDGLGTARYASTSFVTAQISSFSTSLGAVGAGNLTTANLASTVAGLGTAGYLSTLTGIVSTPFLNTTLASTTAGLGTASYISSTQLTSTVSSLFTNFRSLSVNISTLTTSNLAATTGYVSSLQVDTLQFGNGAGWVQFGPIQASIVSTIQLNVDTIYANQVSSSTFVGDGSQLVNLNAASPLQLASTVRGLGTAGYLSTLTGIVSTPFLNTALASTTQGLGTAGYLSTLTGIVSTPYLNATLTSTTQGLGSAGYASTSFVGAQISTFSTSIAAAIGGSVGVTQTVLNSTFAGLATGGYISSSQLFSTVAGIGTGGGGGGGITTGQLTSTTDGLGSIQYASTQRFYISTTSTTAISWPPINVQTVLIQDWSTAVSTVALFTSNTSNYYKNTIVNTSTPLYSTVAGLGSASYASTQWVYIPNISTQAVLPFPSINNQPLSTVSAAFGTFSTLTGLNTYTNFITFSNFAQIDSSQPTELLFTTGATVSSFRIESAGQVSFETGANTSLLAQSTPTLLISQTRTVGINCNAPAYTLDISGTANVSGVLTSRVRVLASTITTSQTIQPSEIGSFFFYTTTTPGLSITLPTPSQAGEGWNVTIQNTSNSLQTFTILTTPTQVLSRSQTLRIFSDGSSWYFI